MLSKIVFIAFILGLTVSLPTKRDSSHKLLRCQDGWMRYHDSCYYMELKKMDFTRAEISCAERGAKLFVADTVEEWLEVMMHSPLNYWTWVGLRYEDEVKEAKWRTEADGLEVSKLDWLSSPRSAENNGMNTVARCVGHYNCEVGNSYTFYYSCGMEFYSICEKNATLVEKRADEV
ncbi:hypothetical protein RB195_020784 [Necator americanus]